MKQQKQHSQRQKYLHNHQLRNQRRCEKRRAGLERETLFTNAYQRGYFLCCWKNPFGCKPGKNIGIKFEYAISRFAVIDHIHKGVSLYTNMNKMNSLQYLKENTKTCTFLQFESHSSKSSKVRAISDLKGNKGLQKVFLK